MSDKQTTPTINGLRLVTPQEAGKKNKTSSDFTVIAVLMKDGKPTAYVDDQGGFGNAYYLQDIPKPRTIRPHKRGEVKLGDTFRHKVKGWDKMVVFVADGAIDLGFDNISYERLLEEWERLTYDSNTGKEVLSVAGVVE